MAKSLAGYLFAACLGIPLFFGLTAPAAEQSASGGGTRASSSDAPEMDEAMARLKEGQWDQALEVLRAAAKKNPELSSPQVALARLLSATNGSSQTRSVLEQAIAEDPDDCEAYAMLAQVALRSRRYTETGLLCDKMLALLEAGGRLHGPSATVKKRQLRRQALESLAAVAEARGDWPGVQKHAESLLVSEPKHAGALQWHARALFQQKKYDQAYDRFKEAAAADEGKNLLGAEASMAFLFRQSGDLSTAGEWILKGIRANPGDYRTRLAAADHYLAAGNLKHAAEQADAAASLRTRSPEPLMAQGAVALHARDFAGAEKYFREAHLASLPSFAPMNQLAIALCGQEDPEKRRTAAELAQVLAKAYPEQQAEAYATLGWALYRAGRAADAESALRLSVSAARPRPDTAYYLVRVLADRGLKDEARKAAAQYLEPSVRGTVPFHTRDEARSLLEELKK